MLLSQASSPVADAVSFSELLTALLTALGVVVVIVLAALGWSYKQSKAGVSELKSDMNRQFDSTNRQFDSINTRLDNMTNRIDKLFEIQGGKGDTSPVQHSPTDNAPSQPEVTHESVQAPAPQPDPTPSATSQVADMGFSAPAALHAEK